MAGVAASPHDSNRGAEAPLIAIGLMSGTSMDGIDAAVLVTDGEGVAEPGLSISRAYEPGLRAELADVLERMVAADDPRGLHGHLCDLEARLTSLNGRTVAELMEKAGLAPGQVDVVGYHGQTVLHRPEAGITIQLGDGAALAGELGITVVNDFRSADLTAGGEGAPLAPAYHLVLAMVSGVMPQVVVNIGGVANVTWLGQGHDPIAFDTGPGNALIDDLIAARTDKRFDDGGALARAGKVDEQALGRLLEHPYFERTPPKSLDRNAFSGAPVAGLKTRDAAATLAAFTARTIAMSARFFPAAPKRWMVSGGGRKNAAIMGAVADLVDAPVVTAEDAGWRGDSIEAEAFAYLAVRSLKGLPLSWPTTTSISRPMPGGVVHRPDHSSASSAFSNTPRRLSR